MTQTGDPPKALLAALLRASARASGITTESINEKLGEEEALYWYSKCSGPDAKKGIAALLRLLG